MGVVEDNAEFVGGGVGEVVGGEFFEGGGEGLGIAGGSGGVGVGLELVFARPCVGEEGEELGDWLEEEGEKDEASVGGDFRDAEGVVQLAGESAVWVGGEADEEENERHLEDADGEALPDVAEAEVADLVGEDGVAALSNLAVVLLGRRIMMIEMHDRPSVVLLLDPFD